MSNVVYDCVQEYGYDAGVKDLDLIGVDPHWVLCIVRMKYPYTYNRSNRGSFTTQYSKAVEVRGAPLIITDCVSLGCSGVKNSHLTQMTATLMPSELDYLSEIFPGDHVLVWMVNSKEKQQTVIDRLKSNPPKPCNRFFDGLKFVGKLGTPRKILNQDGGGPRTVRYSLTGLGFSEFDASQFYEENLALSSKMPLGQYWARLGAAVNKLISSKAGGIPTGEAIDAFLDLLLGAGMPPNFGMKNQPAQLRTTVGLEAPYSFILPEVLGSYLNKSYKSKPGGIIAYADLVEVISGVQEYGDANFANVIQTDPDITIDESRYGWVFSPKGSRTGESRRHTSTPMLGSFLPSAPQFHNKTVWTILSQYLNPAINEMYTALRVNPDGYVVPTLVVRQIPFSTNAPTALTVTKFLNLPRWKIHPGMVRSFDIGRSDAMRVNFIHVYGDPGPQTGKGTDLTHQLAYNPPIRDDIDAARNGMRPYMCTVNCHPKDILTKGPTRWMEILADFIMGMHMVFTGSLTVTGISAPICPGDNLEWDGVVYHIEGVTHNCGISPDGRKSFTTSFSLSHGVESNPQNNDLGIYAGVDPSIGRDMEPGFTFETSDDNQPSTLGKPDSTSSTQN